MYQEVASQSVSPARGRNRQMPTPDPDLNEECTHRSAEKSSQNLDKTRAFQKSLEHRPGLQRVGMSAERAIVGLDGS